MPQLQSALVVLALTSHALGHFRTSFGPEDTYSFPKFRVNFVNNRPMTPQDAQKLMTNGVQGGVDGFMGRPAAAQQSIEASEGDSRTSPTVPAPEPRLQYMKLGHNREYLCLVPKPTEQVRVEPEEPAPVDPSKSWALLAPLTGSCLYHRQGWFTYAYCHNRYVRQFREMEHTHPHPPGGRIPQEDPEFQAYTLGISPEAITSDEKDVSTRDRRPSSGKELQLATGGGQRYLTSRWTDGTKCDKTGKKREIEIQFHCGMTSTDSIQFLKETSVCKYLLVLHTPRLCGEPGFQSARELQPAEPIHCREVLEPSQAATLVYSDPQSNFPYANTRLRDPKHLPNYALQQEKKAKAKALGVPATGLKVKDGDALKKAISQLFQTKDKAGGKTGGKTGTSGGGTSNSNNKGKGTKAGKAASGDKKAAGAGAGGAADQAKGNNQFKFSLDEFEDEYGTLAIKGEDGENLYVQVLDFEGEDGESPDLQKIEDALAAALRKHLGPDKKLKTKDRPESSDDDDDDDDSWYFDDAL